MAEASKQTTEAGEHALEEGPFYMLIVMWISVSTMETCVEDSWTDWKQNYHITEFCHKGTQASVPADLRVTFTSAVHHLDSTPLTCARVHGRCTCKCHSAALRLEANCGGRFSPSIPWNQDLNSGCQAQLDIKHLSLQSHLTGSISTQFTIAELRNQPECPSAYELMWTYNMVLFTHKEQMYAILGNWMELGITV